MWPCPIEIRDVGTQDTMQLLLTKDQHVVKARSPDTPQKTFTDRIGSWRLIWCFENLNAACGCHTSETGPELALMIADELLRRVSIQSRLPQGLGSPSVGRRARHTDVVDLPRSQCNAEQRT
jgi:hypothetical protein